MCHHLRIPCFWGTSILRNSLTLINLSACPCTFACRHSSLEPTCVFNPWEAPLDRWRTKAAQNSRTCLGASLGRSAAVLRRWWNHFPKKTHWTAKRITKSVTCCLFLLVVFHMFRILCWLKSQVIQVVAVFNIPFGVENSDLRWGSYDKRSWRSLCVPAMDSMDPSGLDGLLLMFLSVPLFCW